MWLVQGVSHPKVRSSQEIASLMLFHRPITLRRASFYHSRIGELLSFILPSLSLSQLDHKSPAFQH